VSLEPVKERTPSGSRVRLRICGPGVQVRRRNPRGHILSHLTVPPSHRNYVARRRRPGITHSGESPDIGSVRIHHGCDSGRAGSNASSTIPSSLTKSSVSLARVREPGFPTGEAPVAARISETQRHIVHRSHRCHVQIPTCVLNVRLIRRVLDRC